MASPNLPASIADDWPSLYGELESRRKNELAALLRIGVALAASADLPELLQAIYHSLAGALDLTWFVAGMADEAAGQLTFPLWLEHGQARTAPPVALYRDESLVALAVRLRQPLASAESRTHFATPLLAPGIALPRAYLAVPLLNRGRALGALAVASQRPNAYGEEEQQLLRLVASMLSLAVEKARLYEAVARHARSLEERVIARTVELESEKVRFESTVQSLSEGLLLFDPRGAVSFVNDRALGLLGLPAETLLGLDARALWSHPALELHARDEVSEQFARALHEVETFPKFNVVVGGRREPAALAGGAPKAPPAGGAGENGAAEARRDLGLRLFPVRDGAGKQLGWGLIVQDITRERAIDRMKDELVNVVSHELRTPLASVLGFAELLLTRDYTEAKRRQLVETIHQEAERLSALISDFLDLRRIEAGRQPFVFSDVRLVDVVQAVVADFALTRPRHTLELELQPDLPAVRADPERLGQALRNLLENAIKYSPQGGRVTVAASPAGYEVRVAVRDEGLGLPAEAIPLLFQRFYRVDSSDRRNIGGTGLGLAIVREIISAHGGRVWATSPGPGQGSTFGFTLPAAQAHSSRPAGRPASRPAGQTAPYILVVEDDPGAASLLREHLEAAGKTVVVAAEAETAFDLARQRAPAGVVLDVCLPEPQQGWTLLSRLRRVYPAGRLPIVITSVLDEREKGFALGATEFLTKPYDPRRLVSWLAPAGAEARRDEDDGVFAPAEHRWLGGPPGDLAAGPGRVTPPPRARPARRPSSRRAPARSARSGPVRSGNGKRPGG